jgi:DNA-binding NarL/FixJ family response regulator
VPSRFGTERLKDVAIRAVMLHRHALFKELIVTELDDLGTIEVVAATSDRDEAMDLVLAQRPDALIVERHEGFIGRHEIVGMFARAAETIPGFVLIAPDLTTSEIEVLRDTVSEREHLGEIRALLQGVP